MSLGQKIDWDDTVVPFQLERCDIRGRVARLDGVLGQVLAQHAYPAAVEAMVAEAVLLTAMIGQMIKLRWKLSLQVRGNGPLRTIATDYYAPTAAGAPARLRGWASFDAARIGDGGTRPFDLIGGGYLAILIDQGPGSKPYQGIAPLAGTSLTACAESYFAQSEQLPTRFQLVVGRTADLGGAEHWRGGGVMLQHMPGAAAAVAANPGGESGGSDADDGNGENWTRASALLDTVEEIELAGPLIAPRDLLVRLFHEEIPRVFDAQSVAFGCTCSAEKVSQSLSIYSARDIASMTTADGTVTADCQFCGAHYVLDPATLGFEATGTDTVATTAPNAEQPRTGGNDA